MKIKKIYFTIIYILASLLFFESSHFNNQAHADLSINEFNVPTANSYPFKITYGPDGNLWFTEYGASKIGKITPSGSITEYSTPSNNSGLGTITSGPDGNLWFTESNSNKIGRITTSGSITEFSIPTSGSYPADIITGPDGNLWFTESSGNKIGKITTSGEITEFPVLTASSRPGGITPGSDGNLWFTEYIANKIGKITTSGEITEFRIPTNNSLPQNIILGPDNNAWFTETLGNKIGKITTGANITEFPILTNGGSPNSITPGNDNNLWFVEDAGKIGSITTAGVITEYNIPTTNSHPRGIVTDHDGNLWFTEWSTNKIGRINLPTPTPPQLPCNFSANFGDENGNPLRQYNNNWSKIPYGGNYYTHPVDNTQTFLPFIWNGNDTDTIGNWGCKLTSAAMIINYYAKKQHAIDPNTGEIFKTDPQKLNSWLQQNNGYWSGNPIPTENPTHFESALVSLTAVSNYAWKNGISLSFTESIRQNRDQNNNPLESIESFYSRTDAIAKLNNSLCALNPVILGVNNNGHFIDATGKMLSNGNDTWDIFDPLKTEKNTLIDSYANTFNQIDLASESAPKKHLEIAKYSPIEIYITDPQNRKIGSDAKNNLEYNQINDASYGTEFLSSEEGGGIIHAGFLDIPDPFDGEYILTVIGTGNGQYTIETRWNDNNFNTLSDLKTGNISTGQIEKFAITYNSDSTKLEVKDITPPTTLAELTNGTLGNNNFYTSDVKIKLTSYDGGSGIDKTVYSINDDDEQTYDSPINLTADGVNIIKFHSIDKAGNIEQGKIFQVKIDKTSPEATIVYNLDNFDTIVSGIDNQDYTSISEDKTKPLQPKYKIIDQAGNTTILNTGKIKIGKQVALTIKNIQYNTSPIIDFDDNIYFTLAVTGKSNIIKSIDQYFAIKGDKRIFSSYASNEGLTKIFTKTKGNDYSKEQKPGIVIIKIKTDNGKLTYEY